MKGFQWRLRVRVFPGVRLNFSLRGISVTLGPRGGFKTTIGRGRVTHSLSFGHGLYWSRSRRASSQAGRAGEPRSS